MGVGVQLLVKALPKKLTCGDPAERKTTLARNLPPTSPFFAPSADRERSRPHRSGSKPSRSSLDAPDCDVRKLTAVVRIFDESRRVT